MKRLLCLIFVLGCGAGCTTPVVISNGSQNRIFTPCTSDSFCFRDTYNVAWDYWCPSSYRDYPISYKTKQAEYESNRVEFITVPKAVEYGRGDMFGALKDVVYQVPKTVIDVIDYGARLGER